MDEQTTLVRVTIEGREFELHAIEPPKQDGLYFAAVYLEGQDFPRFKGRTLHALSQAALTEAFSVAVDMASIK